MYELTITNSTYTIGFINNNDLILSVDSFGNIYYHYTLEFEELGIQHFIDTFSNINEIDINDLNISIINGRRCLKLR